MLPISLVVIYHKPGVKAFGKIAFVPIALYPRPTKEKAKKKPKKEKPEAEKTKGGTVEKLKGGLQVINPIFTQIRRRLIISKLVLYYTAATGDAAKTAFAYAGAHMAVNQIMPMLHGNFKVKKEDIQIKGDFEETQDKIYLEARIRISIWGLIRLGLFTFKELRKVGIIKTKEKKEVKQNERKETSN